jgi:hypothetical protein
MQRILSLLIFRSEEPLALDRTFPWWEVNRRPIEALVELQGEVVSAVPGDSLVVACVRLLRCGRSLPRILIDL